MRLIASDLVYLGPPVGSSFSNTEKPAAALVCWVPSTLRDRSSQVVSWVVSRQVDSDMASNIVIIHAPGAETRASEVSALLRADLHRRWLRRDVIVACHASPPAATIKCDARVILVDTEVHDPTTDVHGHFKLGIGEDTSLISQIQNVSHHLALVLDGSLRVPDVGPPIYICASLSLGNERRDLLTALKLQHGRLVDKIDSARIAVCLLDGTPPQELEYVKAHPEKFDKVYWWAQPKSGATRLTFGREFDTLRKLNAELRRTRRPFDVAIFHHPEHGGLLGSVRRRLEEKGLTVGHTGTNDSDVERLVSRADLVGTRAALLLCTEDGPGSWYEGTRDLINKEYEKLPRAVFLEGEVQIKFEGWRKLETGDSLDAALAPFVAELQP